MKVWLIGEQNPYSDDPEDDLVPYPERSAGWRLATEILGMPRAEYLRTFERRNLLRTERWSAPAARASAEAILAEAKDAPLVLLGSKVAAAFGVSFVPFLKYDLTYVAYAVEASHENIALCLPHPSYRCRLWNEKGNIAKARAAVLELVAEAAKEAA